MSILDLGELILYLSDTGNEVVEHIAHGRVAELELRSHLLKAATALDKGHDKGLLLAAEVIECAEWKPPLDRRFARCAFQTVDLERCRAGRTVDRKFERHIGFELNFLTSNINIIQYNLNFIHFHIPFQFQLSKGHFREHNVCIIAT